MLSKPYNPFVKDASEQLSNAGVAKLVDAPDLGSGAARRGGSSPSTRTTIKLNILTVTSIKNSLVGRFHRFDVKLIMRFSRVGLMVKYEPA